MTPGVGARAVVLALAASVCAAAAFAQSQPSVDAPWRTFTGSWAITGQRQSLPTEGGGTSTTLQVSGAVVLTVADGLGRGFRGEVIAFTDGDTLQGRFVWTDQHGDRIFGRLEGEPVEARARFAGTMTGGTGRYAGITGSFAFTWQYVVKDEEGVVEGRTVGLEGRYRREAAQP